MISRCECLAWNGLSWSLEDVELLLHPDTIQQPRQPYILHVFLCLSTHPHGSPLPSIHSPPLLSSACLDLTQLASLDSSPSQICWFCLLHIFWLFYLKRCPSWSLINISLAFLHLLELAANETIHVSIVHLFLINLCVLRLLLLFSPLI